MSGVERLVVRVNSARERNFAEEKEGRGEVEAEKIEGAEAKASSMVGSFVLKSVGNERAEIGRRI